MNMFLHGEDNHRIEWGDIIRNPKLLDSEDTLKHFDVVVANPPFSYRWDPSESMADDVRFKSHGLALYLLEGADDNFGVACLGGECFGEAGAGFLRFSCAEPNDRLQKAVDFIPTALSRTDRIADYLESHPQFRLTTPYAVEG